MIVFTVDHIILTAYLMLWAGSNLAMIVMLLFASDAPDLSPIRWDDEVEL